MERFRVKATFKTKAGSEFVRYWANSKTLVGWIHPETKDRANTYTRGAAGRFLNSRVRNPTARYELEPVT